MNSSLSFPIKLLIALLLLTLLPFTALSVSAEYVEDSDYIVDETEVEYLFSVDTHSEDHVMQGFAAYNGIVFQLHDGGRCVTYRLDNGQKLASFHLGSFYTHNHCGNANFGKEFPEGNTDFPALYVSGDLTTKACYVENVTASSAELIQTIYFDIDPSYTGGQVFFDHARDRLIYMQREKIGIGNQSNIFKLCEFPIPALSDGDEIRYTNEDMLGEPYELPFYSPYYQGASTYGGYILQTYGAFVENSFGSKVGIMCFDAETHDFVRVIPLDGIINQEPQGLFVHNGKLTVCFVNGAVYEIKPKLTVQADGYDMICMENEAQILGQLAEQIPAPYRLLSTEEDAVRWNSQTGEFEAAVTLQTPYNEMEVTLTGTALTHSWGQYQSDGNATCTENGTKTRTCAHSDCQKTETVEEIGSATGHAFDEWKTVKKATPLTDGLMESACVRCNETQSVELKAYGLGALEIGLLVGISVLALLSITLTVLLLRRKR